MTEDNPGHNPAGLVAVTTAVALMGVGSVVAKASEIDGPVLALHRVWIAAVLYFGLALALRGNVTLAGLRTAAPGGLFFGLEVAFFFSSIQLTTVANATVLLALQPVLVLLVFSRRFGEVVARSEMGLAIVAFG
ncbi:MAG: EamA family transporter, partial [Actinomycetia bacterium]|nr:EamA family transporter [Actinomycetes bacterium]